MDKKSSLRHEYFLEMMLNIRLFHYGVGGMPGLDFYRNGKRMTVLRTMPHLVASLALPHEIAAMLREFLPYPFFILCHRKELSRGALL